MAQKTAESGKESFVKKKLNSTGRGERGRKERGRKRLAFLQELRKKRHRNPEQHGAAEARDHKRVRRR